MEQKVSFIPKKQIPKAIGQKRPIVVNLFMFIAVIVFLGTLAIAGGLYFYRALLERNIASLSQSVARVEEVVSTEIIKNLRNVDIRINVAEDLINQHKAVSSLFEALEVLTLKKVRFSQFSYSLNQEGTSNISLSGEADNYKALAFQSDVISKNEYFKNPIFSNFGLNIFGNVTFDLESDISNDLILYKNNLDSVISKPVEQETPSE